MFLYKSRCLKKMDHRNLTTWKMVEIQWEMNSVWGVLNLKHVFYVLKRDMLEMREMQGYFMSIYGPSWLHSFSHTMFPVAGSFTCEHSHNFHPYTVLDLKTKPKHYLLHPKSPRGSVFWCKTAGCGLTFQATVEKKQPTLKSQVGNSNPFFEAQVNTTHE